MFYNTVVAMGAGIVLARKEDDPPYQQWIKGNAVFARTPIAGLAIEGNLVGKYAEAAVYLAKPYAPLGELNLLPDAKVTVAPASDYSPPRIFPHAELDFDGDLRGTADRGAYSLNNIRPRWPPALEIIPIRAK